MIRNIVFDMGGVLIRFDRDYFLDQLNLSEEDRSLLMQEVFLSVEWCQMDRGVLNEDGAYARMIQRLPSRLHEAARHLVYEWDDPILPVPGMEELIAELKEKGYRIFLISNASPRQPEYWLRIPAHRYFDDVLVSFRHGIVKPQPEIYRLAFRQFGIRPEESLFIDDSFINAEGSIYCGMDCFIFRGEAGPLRRWLRGKGVTLSEQPGPAPDPQ
ncbi:MAG: HAD family phosphatase [Lachnospiraceae bacterium]|nr:HAD family phosphatase [Lachnospiraceae bacterium]